jgi:hypothetical protein
LAYYQGMKKLKRKTSGQVKYGGFKWFSGKIGYLKQTFQINMTKFGGQNQIKCNCNVCNHKGRSFFVDFYGSIDKYISNTGENSVVNFV